MSELKLKAYAGVNEDGQLRLHVDVQFDGIAQSPLDLTRSRQESRDHAILILDRNGADGEIAAADFLKCRGWTVDYIK